MLELASNFTPAELSLELRSSWHRLTPLAKAELSHQTFDEVARLAASDFGLAREATPGDFLRFVGYVQ